ncbi:hypothetical protein T265_06539 [Opisthorchis viverrini]|uniref:EF hand n=1 Tax=Opisthorchis viverrini TaxID=6198 RepID=A0A074ZFR6_OPIVI|nr:hypothetical protein T265_06539 [Opisthorchis viverrini]KER26121.1 hypothetical protein T265_06539 [Opisthorchis viverrini]
MDVGAAKLLSLDWRLSLNDEKCVHMSFGGDAVNAFVMHDIFSFPDTLRHIIQTKWRASAKVATPGLSLMMLIIIRQPGQFMRPELDFQVFNRSKTVATFSRANTPPRTVGLASQVSGYDESSSSNANAPLLTEWPHPPVSNRAPIPPPVAPALDQSANPPVPDPWVITSEQKAYYLAQFLRLQPDPRSKLSGLQAKTFFQLSKLPNTELSDIWELSDADCDGQLTLGEFCVAMHLVVLRRNGIPVPRILPCALLEVISSQSLSTLASSHHNEDDAQSTRGGDRYPACTSVMDRSSQNHAFSPAVPRHSRGSPITSYPVTPNLSRQQRRWSISSQSDISSIAEGIMHFESRPNADPQLQHPIPLRAHTLPREGTDSEAPQLYPTNLDQECQHTRLASSPPPPPPPRARLQSSLVGEQRKLSGEAPVSMVPPSSQRPGDSSEGNDLLQVSTALMLHLQHPIPLRAHTLPREGTDSEAPQLYPTNLDQECQHTRLASSPPPPPPPRARLQSSLVGEQRKLSGEAPVSMVPPSSQRPGDSSEGNDLLQIPPHLAPDQVDSLTAGLHHKHPVDTEDPAAIVAQLRRECDGVSQANEKLAQELMQLQQRRIALKILLERLMPLDAGYPTCFEY